MNFSFYNAAKGLVWGTVSKIHIVVSGCARAVIDGTNGTAHDGRVRLRYTDSTGQLTVLTTAGNLHYYDVTDSCLGLVNTGDPVTLRAAFTVSPNQAITSP